MNIKHIDLNLLRLFDAVHRLRNVSRAAQTLGLSQPAASQGLTRLRLQVRDALFVRAPGGVRPTPRADRLALAVRSAIASIEDALNEGERFDPAQSQMTLRLHLSDIGEARFLPDLMAALHRVAAQVQVQSFPLPHHEIPGALDSGVIDFAIGFLALGGATRSIDLLSDGYTLLLRDGHPMLPGQGCRGFGIDDLKRIEYVAVRSHSETLRILEQLDLQDRVRLTSSHFLALPAIVRTTDLGVLMPREIARGFAAGGGYAVVEVELPRSEFTVSLLWSARFESDPANRWARDLLVHLFKGSVARAGADAEPGSPSDRGSRPYRRRAVATT